MPLFIGLGVPWFLKAWSYLPVFRSGALEDAMKARQ